MMWLLSLFNPAAWAQTVAAGGICLALGFGGGVVKGYDLAGSAALHEKVAALARQNMDLIAYSRAKDTQIEADRVVADQNRESQEKFDAEIHKFMAAPAAKSDACRMSQQQLQWLSSATTR